MRIATYNVEWFDNLFDANGNLLLTSDWSGRYKVTKAEQANALAIVFQRIDADGVLIVEAPDSGENRSCRIALENFARCCGLRTRRATTGFVNDTKQEIAFLYDPDVFTAQHAPAAGTVDVPRFDGTFAIDLDIDAASDDVRFSKPPLELLIRAASGFEFRLIGVHLKSKAPHGAKTSDDFARISIANRRKQLAQAIWLRKRVEHYLAENMPLIVAGDLNDGPGLDAFESLFGRSSVEIVLGDAEGEPLFDPHASQALSQRLGAAHSTSRFWIDAEKRFLQALLDYIMVSKAIRDLRPAWRIWHPFDDPACWSDGSLRDALLTASDHFPVSIDLPL